MVLGGCCGGSNARECLLYSGGFCCSYCVCKVLLAGDPGTLPIPGKLLEITGKSRITTCADCIFAVIYFCRFI